MGPQYFILTVCHDKRRNITMKFKAIHAYVHVRTIHQLLHLPTHHLPTHHLPTHPFTNSPIYQLITHGPINHKSLIYQLPTHSFKLFDVEPNCRFLVYFQNRSARRVLVAAAITLTIFLFLVYTSSQYASFVDKAFHLGHDDVEIEFHHAYFTPTKDVITPIDENYKIDGDKICADVKPNSVVLLVPSLIQDVEIRTRLRKSWLGSLATGDWPGVKLEYEFRVAFIFGKGETIADDQFLDTENSVYGDIVQGSFVDSYFNLTRKTLFGLKWVTKFCKGAKYVMKIDVDTFVNVPKLFEKVSYFDDSVDGKIFGRLWEKTTPHRSGKWVIGYKEYPAKYYPPYCDGPIYVISASAVPKLVYTSERMPYFHLEDVFVTGIAARISNVNRIDLLPNVEFRNEPEWVCSFKTDADERPVHLADSEFSMDQIEQIWRCMKEGPTMSNYYTYYRGYFGQYLFVTGLMLVVLSVMYVCVISHTKK